ncbi:MAG: transketolase [Bacteroidetes bacterium]|nr:transketolase [Bacteroidota bacterium]
MQSIANANRATALRMIHAAGSGHPGGTLSCADIVTYLYEREMNIRPKEPDWGERDRFVLSKGHACPVLYAELARCSYFPVDQLMTLRRVGSILQGVPDRRLTPGVDMTTGSLGIGFSAAVGMALGAKKRGSTARIYCMIGDGEIAEGMVWEGLLFAAHASLSNLVCFLDHNKFSSDSAVRLVLNVEPYLEKIKAFGWAATEIDGHDFQQISSALNEARTSNRPFFIVAHTVKGKGVPYMENDPAWHGSLALSDQQLAQALEALGGRGEK